MKFSEVCKLSIFEPDTEYDLFFTERYSDPLFMGRVVGRFLPLFGSFFIECIADSCMSKCPGIYLKEVSND